MKAVLKISLLLSLMLPLLTSAQTIKNAYLNAVTTITNTAVDSPIVKLTGAASSLTFKVDVVKTSGTLTSSKIYVSMTDTLLTNGAHVWTDIDSVTLSDWSKSYHFKYNYNPGSYYRIWVKGGGTCVFTERISYLWRRL